jgi:hypothetical protein
MPMTLRTSVAADYYDFLNQLESAPCWEGHAWRLLYAGVGSGTLTGIDGGSCGCRGGPFSIAESFTITALDGVRFQVVGAAAGDIGIATVGQPFEHDRVRFRINAGSAAFATGNQFTLNNTPPWTVVRRHGVRSDAFCAGNFAILAALGVQRDNEKPHGQHRLLQAMVEATLPASFNDARARAHAIAADVEDVLDAWIPLPQALPLQVEDIVFLDRPEELAVVAVQLTLIVRYRR